MAATPPTANAFSSWTSPRTSRPRHASRSVGGMHETRSREGQNIVLFMPSGSNTRRVTNASIGSPATRSSTSPSRKKPRSLYTDFVPGT